MIIMISQYYLSACHVRGTLLSNMMESLILILSKVKQGKYYFHSTK